MLHTIKKIFYFEPVASSSILMRIRLRSPDGTSTLTISDDATIGELLSSITKHTSIASFEIKRGYPPKPLDLFSFQQSTKLNDTSLNLNGEQLIIIPRREDEVREGEAAKGFQTHNTQQKQAERKETRSQSENIRAPLSTNTSTLEELDTPEISIPSHDGTVVLRVMPDDNSCLFRALSTAVLGSGLDSVTELRSMVAQSIQAQPDLYSEVVLQKSPDEYCRWIQSSDAWGGGIEMGILSQAFDIEISSINVQDLRVDRFNEGAARRCILVYSGIHYDTIAISTSNPLRFNATLEIENDVKVFDAKDDVILDKAIDLCRILQRKHYYTDTSKFSIKCLVCGWKGKGEKDATQHAIDTNHYSFDEAN